MSIRNAKRWKRGNHERATVWKIGVQSRRKVFWTKFSVDDADGATGAPRLADHGDEVLAGVGHGELGRAGGGGAGPVAPGRAGAAPEGVALGGDEGVAQGGAPAAIEQPEGAEEEGGEERGQRGEGPAIRQEGGVLVPADVRVVLDDEADEEGGEAERPGWAQEHDRQRGEQDGDRDDGVERKPGEGPEEREPGSGAVPEDREREGRGDRSEHRREPEPRDEARDRVYGEVPGVTVPDPRVEQEGAEDGAGRAHRAARAKIGRAHV